MIDSHMHLEQKDYDKDRDLVIKRCKESGMKAIISVFTHQDDFDRIPKILDEYPGFVFAVAGLHPQFIKELTEENINNSLKWIKDNAHLLHGVGEQGLDYFWTKEPEYRKKQQELFVKFIKLAKDLNKVIVVHTRDAHKEVIKILEDNGAKKVQLHMWGDNKLVKKIIENGWYISVGPVIAHSKKHRKVVRDMPMDKLMLETDSPWFGGKDSNGRSLRGEPTNIKVSAEEIAKIKKIPINDVLKICGKNTIKLFSLPLKI